MVEDNVVEDKVVEDKVVEDKVVEVRHYHGFHHLCRHLSPSSAFHLYLFHFS